MHGWQAKKRMHLCMASNIRAMPEKVKPPAKLADIYFVGVNFFDIKNKKKLIGENKGF